MGRATRRPGWRVLAGLWAVWPAAALAATGADFGSLTGNWSFDPLIWALTALLLWLYLRGADRLSRRGRAPAFRRQVSVLAGLALVWLALVSPLNYAAGHLFWVHQIQNLILRIAGPLLILFAAPQGAIYAGMPRWLRRATVLRLIRFRGTRALGRVLKSAPVALLLFVASLWVWQWPAFHNAAVLNAGLQWAMHATMLGAGVLFFWVIFDRRDPPGGLAHGARQVMLVAAILTEILIGAFTAMKTVVLYPAYAEAGRLGGISAMADEATGGFLMWPPACIMLLAAVLMVVYRWNGAEEREWMRARRQMGRGSNSAALLIPETAEELWLVVRPKNRRLALGLGALAIAMLLITFGTAETVHSVY